MVLRRYGSELEFINGRHFKSVVHPSFLALGFATPFHCTLLRRESSSFLMLLSLAMISRCIGVSATSCLFECDRVSTIELLIDRHPVGRGGRSIAPGLVIDFERSVFCTEWFIDISAFADVRTSRWLSDCRVVRWRFVGRRGTKLLSSLSPTLCVHSSFANNGLRASSSSPFSAPVRTGVAFVTALSGPDIELTLGSVWWILQPIRDLLNGKRARSCSSAVSTGLEIFCIGKSDLVRGGFQESQQVRCTGRGVRAGCCSSQSELCRRSSM